MKKTYTRKLRRVSTHSYAITIPKELIEEFGWRERQKLKIEFGGRKHDFTVRDWKE